jgi:alkylhydroperoxidase/carboxymuconolactone decarboxylase family protein YurZ
MDPKPNPIGLETYRQLFGEEDKSPLRGLREFTINHLFTYIWSRSELAMRDRSMITVALLAAQGREGELRKHVKGALHQGISLTQITEIMIQVAHYSGWPAGHRGEEIARAVFDEVGGRDLGPNAVKAKLIRLNEEIGEKEKLGDTSYFESLLGDDLVFRRASGAIHHKADYLKGLKTIGMNPYELLETSVVSVYVDVADGQESAVANVRVRAKRKDDEYAAVYENVRVFEKLPDRDTWRLVSWTNTKVS